MQKTIYSILALSIFTFSACSGNAPKQQATDDSDTLAIDTSLGIDTTDIQPIDTVQVDSAGYIEEEAALSSQIEKKYGKQWDFCECVVKNDSVNKALENADDETFDAILVRMDTIDNHCKEMLTSPNTTPEERERHQRKVKKCLQSAQ